jgi:hypothetical protein
MAAGHGSAADIVGPAAPQAQRAVDQALRQRYGLGEQRPITGGPFASPGRVPPTVYRRPTECCQPQRPESEPCLAGLSSLSLTWGL